MYIGKKIGLFELLGNVRVACVIRIGIVIRGIQVIQSI